MHGKLWDVGDVFEAPFPGAEPNRHFTVNGVMTEGDKQRIVYSPGDDPRTTKALYELAKKYKMEGLTKNTTRKKLHNFVVKFERDNNITQSPVEAQQTAPAANPDNSGAKFDPENTFDNPILNKPFMDMSPDEINKIKVDEIRTKLGQPPYSLELGTGVIAKAELIKRGIQIEEQRGMQASGAGSVS